MPRAWLCFEHHSGDLLRWLATPSGREQRSTECLRFVELLQLHPWCQHTYIHTYLQLPRCCTLIHAVSSFRIILVHVACTFCSTQNSSMWPLCAFINTFTTLYISYFENASVHCACGVQRIQFEAHFMGSIGV